jgi:hypothetical protein
MIREELHGANLNILLSLYPKILAIASGATPIGSAVAHPIEISRQKEIARNFGYIVNKTLITPIGRYSQKVKKDNSKSCVYWFSQTKAMKYNSRVASSRQNLNIVVEIYHEGKTPGSVLCGLVYAHGCALLVCIRVYDAKKNPGGRTGYPENHWDSFFVSPKCGKRMGLTGFPNSSTRGLNLK